MRFLRPTSTIGALPRVTVVIPCYNYARFLTDAVRSATQQEGVGVNVVIIDDASTDESCAVAESLVAADPRVRLVRHEKNQGHVETSNEALSYGAAEYLVKLDADDLLSRGSLQRSTALMSQFPDMAFCYGFPLRFSGETPNSYPVATRSWTVWDGREWISQVLRSGHNVIAQPEVVIRQSALRITGGYRPELRWAEDYNLWLRLATTGGVGRVNGPIQGLYRVHDASFQRSASDIELTDLRARIDAAELFLAECGLNQREVDRLRGIGIRSLAREARLQAAAAATDELRTTYTRIAGDLDARLGEKPRYSVSGNRTIVGGAYRRLLGKLRWRRWRRYGI